MGNKKMQILLLGNGLLQSFGGESWNEFLEDICSRNDLPSLDKIICPEPLKAILLTEDKIDIAMKEKCAKILKGNQIKEDLALILKDLMGFGFDHILTTNYTYEIEQAAVYPENLTEYKLKRMACSTKKSVEKKYLIHTYNKVRCDSTDNMVWHIHGEARKPNSTILGHYYYGNSLFRIEKAAGAIKRTKIDEAREAESWVEAFILGDIYCLGFGYSLNEFDLWWLLNRKALEKKNAGKLYFYEPKDDDQWAKIDLLKLMKTTNSEELVRICDLGYDKNGNIDWQSFYRDAIVDIKERAGNERIEGASTEKELLTV